ncbi:MAG: autotransporter-associated beta strand repeat-containing protein, partial [bacterium]
AQIAHGATLLVGSTGGFSAGLSAFNNGTLELTNATGLTLNALSGQGDLIIDGGNYHESATNALTGTLTIGSAATYTLDSTGTFAFTTIRNDGAISISARNTFNLINSISGLGSLTSNIGTGKFLTLDKNNSYEGTTAILSGKLQVGKTIGTNGGSTEGTLGIGNVTVASGAELIFNRSNEYSLAAGNFITGAGTITLAAEGNLIVASDNQINTTGLLNLGLSPGSPTRTSLDLSSGSITVGSLAVRTGSTTAAAAGVTDLITIGLGKSLNVVGVGATVDIGANSGYRNYSSLTMVGLNGAFNVGTAGTATDRNFNIGISAAATLPNAVTLDMSGLGTFYANLGTKDFLLGADTSTSTTSTAGTGSDLVKLAVNSTIIATNLKLQNNASGVDGQLLLGSGATVLQVDNFWITGNNSRSNFTVGFNEGNVGTGTLDLRGKSSARANLAIQASSSLTADFPTPNNVASSVSLTGLLDLRGHSSSLMLGKVTVGSRVNNPTTTLGTTGAGKGELYFDSGTFDATSITVGEKGQAVTEATKYFSAEGQNAAEVGIVGFGGGTSAATINIGEATIGKQDLNYTGTGTNAFDYTNTVSGVANSTLIGGTGLGVMEFAGNSTGTIGTLTLASSTTGVGNAKGYLKVTNGGSVTVGSISGAYAALGAISTANIVINGGTLNLLGDIVRTPSFGTSTFNISLASALQYDGVLDMTGHSIGDAGNTVNLTVAGVNDIGTLKNVLAFNGTAGLLKAGNGTLVLSGANFANGVGGVTIGAGTLQINSTNALGAGSFLNFSGTSTLQFGTGITTDVSSNFISSVAGARATVDTNGNNVKFANALLGLTNFTKDGLGTLTLKSANSFAGNVTVSAGTLQLGEDGDTAPAGGYLSANGSIILNATLDAKVANALGTSPTSVLVLNTDSILNANGNIITVGPVTFAGGTITGSSASVYGAVILGGAVGVTEDSVLAVTNITTGDASPTVTVDAGKGFYVTGVIKDGSSNGTTRNHASSLTKAGEGALYLQGNNTFTGGITLNAGSIHTGDAGGAYSNSTGSLGGASNNITITGGSIDLEATTQTVGTVTIENAGTAPAAFTITNGTLAATSLVVTANQNLSIDAVISGTGSVAKSGTGNLTLAATNNYTGGTTISNGTLTLGADGALGSATGALTVSGGTVDFANNATSVGAVTISGSGEIKNGDLTATSITASGTSPLTAKISSNIVSAGSLTKSGNGTLQLSGAANSYSGSTAINAGTLQVDGAISSSVVAVNAGGTLRGTGTIANAVNVSGTIAPGTSSAIGTLTTGATTLNGGSLTTGGTLKIRFFDMTAGAGTGWDLLKTDDLTINATTASRFNISLSTVDVSGNISEANHFDKGTNSSYKIIDVSGVIGGALNPDDFNILYSDFRNNLGGGTWTVSELNGSVYVDFTKGSFLYYSGSLWDDVGPSAGGLGAWDKNDGNWNSDMTASFGGTGDSVAIGDVTANA